MSLYELPSKWEYWFVSSGSAVMMAVVGEYWCALQELKDIPSAYSRAEMQERLDERGER